jgi:uncharacterized ParB-like nuclease family protein
MSNKKKKPDQTEDSSKLEAKEVSLPEIRKVVCKVLQPELVDALFRYLGTRPHAEVNGLIQSLSQAHAGEFEFRPAPGPESQGS